MVSGAQERPRRVEPRLRRRDLRHADDWDLDFHRPGHRLDNPGCRCRHGLCLSYRERGTVCDYELSPRRRSRAWLLRESRGDRRRHPAYPDARLGSLPAGMTLNSDGTFSGSPTTGAVGSNSCRRSPDGRRGRDERPVVDQRARHRDNVAAAPRLQRRPLLHHAGGSRRRPYLHLGEAVGHVPDRAEPLVRGRDFGIPSANGSKTITFSVSDGVATVTKALTIVVSTATALTVTTPSLASTTVGAAYSWTLAATGGSIPYSWSIPTACFRAGSA